MAVLLARLRAIPRPLAILLCVAAVQSVAWTVLTAPLQGPDEQNHAAYVQYLAETGHGPAFGAVSETYSTESIRFQDLGGLRALVGLLSAKPGWTQAEQQAFGRVEAKVNKAQRSDGRSANPVAQNPPLYYLYSAIGYRAALALGGSLPTRLLWMRLANVPLYLLVVALAWLIIGEVLGRRRWPQTVGTGCVALLPQLAFMSGVINPDIALAAVWAALVYVALLVARREPRPGLIVGLGALGAASTLTHGRGLAALVPVLVVLAYSLWRHRTLARRRLAAIHGAAVAVLVAGATWAYVYSNAHGGLANLGGHGGSLKGFASYLWQFYLPRLDSMAPPVGPAYGYRQVFIHTFIGTFGSLEVEFPAWVYSALQVAAAIGLIALVVALSRHWDRVRLNFDFAAILLVLFATMLLLLHVASYRTLQGPPHDPIFTGRYLLPLVSLFGLAIALVVGSAQRLTGLVLGSALLSAGVLLSLSGLGLTLARFYA